MPSLLVPLTNSISIVQFSSVVMVMEFQYYPLLPTELQEKIWRLTLLEPRIIELGATPKGWLYDGRALQDVDDLFHRVKLTSNSPRTTLIPAALETCPLSRAVALKFYSKLTSRHSFFDPRVDTLFFGKEFDFTDGWDKWHRLIIDNPDIRHVAFDLLTFGVRNDFHCLTKIARAQKERGITLVMEGPIEPSTQNHDVGPRYRSIEHQDFAASDALRTIGRVFTRAQNQLIVQSWETNQWYFRSSGRYPFDDHGQGGWRMPKINFLVEDEVQAGVARADRQARKRLAEIRRAEQRTNP